MIEEVRSRWERDGIDAWFDLMPRAVGAGMPRSTTRPRAVMDVWFDSGMPIMRDGMRPEILRPDLYLEGSDRTAAGGFFFHH